MADLYQQAATRLWLAHPHSGSEIEPLVELLRECPMREIGTDEELCREGDTGEEIFFVLDGEVRILKQGPTGEDRELTVLEAPVLLGHMSLIDNSKRSATCIAKRPLKIAVMGLEQYKELLRDVTAKGRAFRRLLIASLTRQLVEGNAKLTNLLTKLDKKSGHETKEAVKEDPTDTLLKAAGVLTGWDVDMKGLEQIEVVEDEDAKRHRRDNPYWR